MSRSYNVLVVFLLCWGGLALFINDFNSHSFGLQNSGVEAIVERSAVWLEGATLPEFVPSGDTFSFREHSYAMKQPGQFFLGAIVYWPLFRVNLRFVNHYDYVSNIITMLTSGLLVAVAATLAYLITKSYWTPLILVFGTIVWPYAGVSHHDIYAMSVVTIAAYLAYLQKYFWSGVAAGLTLFFSMLPLSLPLALGIAIAVATRRLEVASRYVLGFLIGLVPSLLFNYLNFDSPLLFPNLAGKVADTMPVWDLANFVTHLGFYLVDYRSAIWAFSPILLFGVVGYFELVKMSKILGYYMILATLLLLVHISTQETFGGYQYGPRYLLPLMPILATAASLSRARLAGFGKVLFVATFCYSVVVASIGALTTVMYPMPNSPFAPVELAKMIANLELPRYRMLPVGIILVGLALLGSCLKHVDPVRRPDNKLA